MKEDSVTDPPKASRLKQGHTGLEVCSWVDGACGRRGFPLPLGGKALGLNPSELADEVLMLFTYHPHGYTFHLGPVVQWVACWTSNLEAWVRFPAWVTIFSEEVVGQMVEMGGTPHPADKPASVVTRI